MLLEKISCNKDSASRVLASIISKHERQQLITILMQQTMMNILYLIAFLSCLTNMYGLNVNSFRSFFSTSNKQMTAKPSVLPLISLASKSNYGVVTANNQQIIEIIDLMRSQVDSSSTSSQSLLQGEWKLLWTTEKVSSRLVTLVTMMP
jgi:hypothetical protein